MRRLVAAVVIAACVGGAALAQQRPPDDGRFRAEWEVRGNPVDFYPDAALSNSAPGAVELCCTPRPDRTIDCRVGFEWPTGFGFGEASLRIAETYRMSEASYAAFHSDPENWMQIPMRYRVAGTRHEHLRALDQITQRTQGLCRNPGAPVS